MSLDAERWLAAEAIFHEALHTPEPARASMLTARCKGDTTLMEELRSLLAACGRGTGSADRRREACRKWALLKSRLGPGVMSNAG